MASKRGQFQKPCGTVPRPKPYLTLVSHQISMFAKYYDIFNLMYFSFVLTNICIAHSILIASQRGFYGSSAMLRYPYQLHTYKYILYCHAQLDVQWMKVFCLLQLRLSCSNARYTPAFITNGNSTREDLHHRPAFFVC